MTKRDILQEAFDKAAFLADPGPRVQGIATRDERGAYAAMNAVCPDLLAPVL